MISDPRKTYTMQDFINSGGTVDIKYQEMALVELLGDISFPVFNVINDYMPEIKDYLAKIELNDEEFLKYKYKPRLLANDLYGNGELGFMILLMNDICNAKEFNKKIIYLIKPDDLGSILSSIYNSEKEHIDEYNAKSNTSEED